MPRDRLLLTSDSSHPENEFLESLFEDHRAALVASGLVFKGDKCFFSSTQTFEKKDGSRFSIINDVAIAKYGEGFRVITNALTEDPEGKKRFENGEFEEARINKYLFNGIKKVIQKSLINSYKFRCKTDHPHYGELKSIYESIENEADDIVKTVDGEFKILKTKDEGFVVFKYDVENRRYSVVDPVNIKEVEPTYPSGPRSDEFYLDSASAKVEVHNLQYLQKLQSLIVSNLESLLARKDQYASRSSDFIIPDHSGATWFNFSKGSVTYQI